MKISMLDATANVVSSTICFPAFLKVENGPVICSCLMNKSHIFFGIIAGIDSGG
jgi:hypothetical protein